MNNPKVSKIFRKLTNSRYIVLILLILGFIFQLLIYFNTTRFHGISEASSILNGIEQLRQEGRLYVFIGNYTFGLSYIGFFFKYIIGSIHYFFIFQCLLATLSIYFVYLITYRITTDRVSAIISIILSTFYLDFAILPSIAYNQILEIFFTSSALLVTFNLIKLQKLYSFLLYSILLSVIIYTSLLFRGTLKYFSLLIFIFSIILFITRKVNKQLFYRLVTFSVLFTIFNTSFPPEKFFSDPNGIQTNSFFFYGHTLYGGHGGEGSFIYAKNRNDYNNKLQLYKMHNNIDTLTIKDINAFQKSEIITFIKEHPTQWVLLQFKKLIYTYSIIPIKDNVTILITGKLKIGFYGGIIILQLTFIIPLLLLIFFFNKTKFKELLSNEYGQFMVLMLIYLILATSIIGQYQERYRIVVMITAIIPFCSIFFNPDYFKYLRNHKWLLIRRFFYLLIPVILWIYQVYKVFYIDNQRYFNAKEQIETQVPVIKQ
jgi:hypothetical protein